VQDAPDERIDQAMNNSSITRTAARFNSSDQADNPTRPPPRPRHQANGDPVMYRCVPRSSPVVLLATLAAAFLSGCGGGGTSTVDGGPPDTILAGAVVSSFSEAAPLAGAVVAPYVAGATVFLDLNRNLTQDEDEPTSALSDAQGQFRLAVPASVSDAQIDRALIVARRPSNDPLLPVPLAAPAASFRGSGAELMPTVNSLTTMAAAEMTSDRTIDAHTALDRVRETLPILGQRDLFADLARVASDDPRLRASRLIAAQVLGEHQQRLDAVAKDLLTSSPGETTVPVAAPESEQIAQKRAKLMNTRDAIDPGALVAQVRAELAILNEVALQTPAAAAERLTTIQSRIETARQRRDDRRAAEAEASRRAANDNRSDTVPSPIILADDEPMPDPTAIIRRDAQARDSLRNADRVTLIVMFKRNADRSSDGRRDEVIASMPSASRGTTGRTFHRAIEGFTITIPEARVEEFIERALANPHVDRIEIDEPISRSIVSPQSPVPSWGLDRTDARGTNGEPRLNNNFAWAASGQGITAFIVDTGIAPGGVFASGQIQAGFTSIGDGQGTRDCNGHGTHVAATVASPIYGIAKQAALVPVRVLDCNGAGSTSTVVAGLDWILQQIAADPTLATRSVVNLSLGGSASSTLDQAVARLISSGVTVVVAAGNNGDDACSYSPARVGGALTVAATDWNDTRASFSNYGSCVDLFAPGQSITSASMTGGALTLSGTSMAAPHVTGAVAQWLQALGGATPSQISASVLAEATTGVVSQASGSPNRLLFAQASASSGGGDSGSVTEPQPAGSISIGSLTGRAARVTQNGNWRATVEIQVLNADGLAVAGATVTGDFSSGGTGLNCITSNAGRCAITSGTLSRRTSATTWMVRSLSASGLTYNAGGNTASRIQINRP
jgi:hypothetical protein